MAVSVLISVNGKKAVSILVEPFEGMPAALAGLKAGDRILAIDTVDVTDKSSDEVSALVERCPQYENGIEDTESV
mgnify:CR=1 FL=1